MAQQAPGWQLATADVQVWLDAPVDKVLNVSLVTLSCQVFTSTYALCPLAGPSALTWCPKRGAPTWYCCSAPRCRPSRCRCACLHQPTAPGCSALHPWLWTWCSAQSPPQQHQMHSSLRQGQKGLRPWRPRLRWTLCCLRVDLCGRLTGVHWPALQTQQAPCTLWRRWQWPHTHARHAATLSTWHSRALGWCRCVRCTGLRTRGLYLSVCGL